MAKKQRRKWDFVPFPREWNKMVGYCCTSSPHTLCSLSHEDQKELEKSIFFHVYCNHRTVWVGRGPYKPSSPGMEKLGHPHWVLVAWSSLTLNVHCCSGHPVPPPHHPYCGKKKFKKEKNNSLYPNSISLLWYHFPLSYQDFLSWKVLKKEDWIGKKICLQ